MWTDVSEILGVGVYALLRRDVVVYVGKSKSLYARVYAHRAMANRAARGKSIPDWLPTKGFVFDAVWVQPCSLERLDSLEAEMIDLYKPKFNLAHKTALKITAPITILVGGVPVTLNAPPPMGVARRA